MPTTTHRVIAADLRAQVAQGEFFRNNTPDMWLPYIWQTFEQLPAMTRERIDTGHPQTAEYYLLQAEKFAGIITHDVLSERVRALDPELD